MKNNTPKKIKSLNKNIQRMLPPLFCLMVLLVIGLKDGYGQECNCPLYGGYQDTVYALPPPTAFASQSIINCPDDRYDTVHSPSDSVTLLDYRTLSTATCNCANNPSITQNPIPGTRLGVGNHTVTLTISNIGCNPSSCSFNVHVSYQPNIPTLSQWGLIILALLLLTVGIVFLKKLIVTSAEKKKILFDH